METTQNHKPTPAEIKAVFDILQSVAEAIRELGEVPSGHLYANLMSKLSLEQYEQLLDVLKGAGLVRESNAHLLTWVGGSPVTTLVPARRIA